MSQVSFLFGAGASANALPVVKNISGRIRDLRNWLINETAFRLSDTETFPVVGNSPKEQTKYEMMQEFLSALEWLEKESDLKNHASIDTFAKKLMVTDKRKEFLLLKATLSCFFILEQRRVGFDKRYDTLISSIINRNLEFPKNARILTWNYDYQLELAMGLYIENPTLTRCQTYLNVFPSRQAESLDKFAVFKLNGTTSIIRQNSADIYTPLNEINEAVDVKLIEKVIEIFAIIVRGVNEYRSMLTFAWENIINKDIINDAKESTVDTEVLVVTGYSFPFFNRGIDKSIIGNMKKLRKVYIQNFNATQLINSFQAIYQDTSKIQIEPIDNVDQFFLPYEL